PAPDFGLPDQSGQVHRLADYRGRWVLLYFYPRDDTPGCTKEACAIRDNYAGFEQLEAKVLGVSTDPVKSHARFANKYALPFTLLADEDKAVVENYGVWGQKKFMGREFMGTHRVSFLIDPEGVIAKVYDKVKPQAHAEEVLNDLQALSQEGKS
ncbi:MAG: thioredoxin-dependent thiol peroxidase, partial [Anaerolineae bacterium]